ncbi:MAG TPA: hypothetical protein VK526_07820, partial [Bradyrhizobium sp.]|nr:hypothetical protein [Bradyrhizobium sp.]
GRQLIFETCLEREVAGTDNELVHPGSLILNARTMDCSRSAMKQGHFVFGRAGARSHARTDAADRQNHR